MTRLLLISQTPGELRAALWRDERLTHLLIERDDKPGLAGRILSGRVTRVDKALNAAFVALDGGLAGFLPLARAQDLTEGDKARFRVVKPAVGGKGPQVEPVDEGARDTTVADWLKNLPAPDALAASDPAWRQVFPNAAPSDWKAGEAQLIEDLEALCIRRIALPGGGSLLIEPAETLRAIDVDSGADQRSALEINLEAAREAARQIVLRALSGLIVIDFLPLEPREERRRLRDLLAGLLEPEEGRVEIETPSPSGVTVIHRQRLRLSQPEIMGVGPRWTREPATTAFTALRQARIAPAAAVLTLRASPAVIAALQDSGPAAAARALVESERGHDIALEPDPLRDDSNFEIS